ncbi:NADPH:quinone oxidoreductase family protein [Sphingomicrobium astaxanthinifaciens]|uniref:NADPH:quinone oxidoreductase family protein n=1 Tax=Sphingomicrobium astaxanthinifaciens TaxID=1227949 RepID=UPI001FCBC3DD|nr:NADPH:quinone oxidoreductase family protein [Sphingomicrobium astaxanthinifaciens]MCJ7421817.1 NADPH:quinone oxidoreductase family protein [Sphingomicrobium astaxanthinifaciens]
MRTLLSHEPGGPETLRLEEVASPEPGPGEVRIAVKAAAINYPDLLIIQDLYQMKPPRPFAPGGEVAGVIDRLGEGVTHLSEGDRVIAVPGFGGLAEQLVIGAKQAIPLPEGVSFREGAALLLTYATAIHALKDRGRIAEGSQVLVLGAAGGVGLAGIELAKAFGARVVAAVSSPDKARVAKEAGADDCVIYARGPLDKDASKALARQFKDAAQGEGFDIVLDPVGGDYAGPALRSLGWQGRFLVVGFPAGIPKLPLNLALLKEAEVSGVFWGAFAMRGPEAYGRQVKELFDLLAAGKISPRVTGTYPLEKAGKAIAALATRKVTGKLVVTMD